ncbi:hypothetical protein IG631_12903 [Alternaria alternata]|nr:hypothetical protein IG631_12903 [Alternaria alternata]
MVIIGVLTAWAWGFHRVLDGIELKVPEIDATKSGVTGCSRLGKAALAAGLFDKRIAVTMPMCSGVQGAGPYRYSLSGQGESLENALGMSIPSGGHCDMSGYADILPFVQQVLQGKSTTRNYDDLKNWKAMPEAYPWGNDVPKGK